MPRLPAAIFATWLAVLGGVAPVLACAAASVADCCPDGSAAPCSETDPSAAGARACCAATPNPAPVAFGSPARVEQPGQASDDAPHLPAVSFLTQTPPPTSSRPNEAFAPAALAPRDASQTYLRTLRLRL